MENGFDNHNNTTTTNNSMQPDQQQQQHQPTLDQLDNLWLSSGNGNVNNWEEEALDQYESESDRAIDERFSFELDQSSQRLFQDFQTSACAVAQIFKEKSTGATSAYNAFQTAAASVTVLYKDSLDACKAHHDLGVALGQQRKVKELIAWLRKKKRRTIRKDEFISFLVGKQAPPLSSLSTSNQHKQSIMNNRHHRQHHHHQQQQQQHSMFASTAQSAPPSHSIAEINPDLATFREALVMHNRSRDVSNSTINSHYSASSIIPPHPPITNITNNHIHHHRPHHHHHHLNHSNNNNNNSNPVSSSFTNNLSNQPLPSTCTSTSNSNGACDDLECFFCEQVATHIELKRSSSCLNSNNSTNVDMESPTRKRGRFY